MLFEFYTTRTVYYTSIISYTWTAEVYIVRVVWYAYCTALILHVYGKILLNIYAHNFDC
jgi:hypothetical protein